MSGADSAQQKICVEQGVPMVLALVSPASEPLRERLLMTLALSCAFQGGRVLVLERGICGAASIERGVLHAVPDEFAALPGELRRGAHGVLYADLSNMAPADMYVALDLVSGTPARFDMVLLNTHGAEPEDLFMASLAQRVVITTSAGDTLLPRVRAQIERLATQHQQRHFTLAIDDQLPQARNFYRQLLCDPALSQVECELLEALPAAVAQGEMVLQDFARTPEALALLNAFRQEALALSPRGGLQLFWRSLMFCNACSLKLCRSLIDSGKALEVCPVQKF